MTDQLVSGDFRVALTRNVLAHYMTVTRDGQPAKRGDLLPENLAFAMANLFFSEYEPDASPAAVTPRIMGENLVRLFGVNLTGRNILQLFERQFVDHYMAVFQRMFSGPCVCLATVSVRSHAGLVYDVERLTCPLVGDGGRRFILACYAPPHAVVSHDEGGVSILSVSNVKYGTQFDGKDIFAGAAAGALRA